MPSEYFLNFPQVGYTLDPNAGPGDYTVVTDIFKRVRIHSTILNDARVYYPYQILDGDTPDNIAHRYYGATDYYWVVLIVNNIIDPIREWPKAYQSFLKYLIDVYGSVQTAQSTIHHYTKTITKTSSLGDQSTETSIIDLAAYNALTDVVPAVFTFSDGNTVTVEVSRSSVDCYTFEDQLNEAKRNILLLKDTYISQIKKELELLLGV